MTKVELEAKVDALNDEINFLRVLFAAVRTPSPSIQRRQSLMCEAAAGIHSSLKGLQLPYLLRALSARSWVERIEVRDSTRRFLKPDVVLGGVIRSKIAWDGISCCPAFPW